MIEDTGRAETAVRRRAGLPGGSTVSRFETNLRHRETIRSIGTYEV